MAEEIKDRVLNITSRNFSITKCPEKVFQQFIEFCKEESNDNYSMGLKLLLDARRTNIKEVLLYEQYMELNDRVNQLEERAEKEPKEPVNGPKCFGGIKAVKK